MHMRHPSHSSGALWAVFQRSDGQILLTVDSPGEKLWAVMPPEVSVPALSHVRQIR
jgi:hypothetical protein